MKDSPFVSLDFGKFVIFGCGAVDLDAVGFQVVDPYLASYEVENPILMVRQLAQTTVRSELGKMELDTVFKERDKLNEKIVVSLVVFLDMIQFMV